MCAEKGLPTHILRFLSTSDLKCVGLEGSGFGGGGGFGLDGKPYNS